MPGATDQVSRQIISETLVDEAYHVLLVVNACKITRGQRKLYLPSFPMYRLEKAMVEAQASYSKIRVSMQRHYKVKHKNFGMIG